MILFVNFDGIVGCRRCDQGMVTILALQGAGRILHCCGSAALQDYAPIKYDDLHEYLIRSLTARNKKFEPAVPKHAAAVANSLDTAKAVVESYHLK